MDIKQASIEELEKEIERRNKEKSIPQMLDLEIRKNNLIGISKNIEDIVVRHADGKDDEDDDHYVFEAVLEAMYGKSIWGWWNDLDQ